MGFKNSSINLLLLFYNHIVNMSNSLICNEATSALLLVAINPNIASVKAQGQATVTVNGGVSYSIQAVFQPLNVNLPPVITPIINATNEAIVVVLAGVEGIYAFVNATVFNITAIPNSGWKFDHWVISGGPLTGHGGYSFTDTPTDNPYNVNHGYGYTYDYHPVFSPTSSTSPTPTVSEFSTSTAIIIAAILVIVAFGTYAYTKRIKK